MFIQWNITQMLKKDIMKFVGKWIELGKILFNVR